MDSGTILQLAGTVRGIASPALLIAFRSSAHKDTDKKAENLATIHDTGKITDQVERRKSGYQMWFQASRFVYENENALLKGVWRESWVLQAKARSLTPVFDRTSSDEAERRNEHTQRTGAYAKQVNHLKVAVIKNKYFLSIEIYSSCEAI
jgi:hypothetical protein